MKLQLVRTPVVEAVFDIDCDFSNELDLRQLRDTGETFFGSEYTPIENAYHVNVNLDAGEGDKFSHSSQRNIAALRFRSEDKRQIVQIRPHGFSFNRLEPYTSLDDYTPELKVRWRMFRERFAPISISRIALRFLNKLEIPSDGTEISEYIHLQSSIFRSKEVKAESFIFATEGQVPGEPIRTKYTLATVHGREGVRTLFFDNEAAIIEQVDPGDEKAIINQIERIRKVKNTNFEEIFTEKCLAQYY